MPYCQPVAATVRKILQPLMETLRWICFESPIIKVLCLVIFCDENKMQLENEYVTNRQLKLAKRTEKYGRIDRDEAIDYPHYSEIRVF